MANKVLLKKSSTVAKVPVVGDLDYGEIALNYADGKLYFKNSTNVVQPLGIAYTKVIANTTAKINQGYIANTGAGSFTITLPASPQTGNYVIIVDDASFDTNNLYVSGGAEPIVGIYENLTLNIAGVSVTLLYDGGQWNVYTQVGATGGTGAGTEGTIHNYNSFGSSLVPSLNNTYKLGNTSYGWISLYYGDGTIQSTSSNADGSSITNSSGTITAQAGGLAGNTLNSGVVYSSLTTLGTQIQRINWQGSGVAAPQFSSSSVGTKLLLYPAVGGSSSDYAIGIDSATIWNSVPLNDVNYFFKWYGGTTNIASLTGTGNFTLAGDLAVNGSDITTTGTGTATLFNTNATTLNMGGAATTVSIGASSGTTTVNNNLVVTGTFTVNGTTETINATTITVDDKNIELGSVASPTNLTADGGGITLKGATDKTFNWVNATSSWTSSEHLDLASAKAYYIAGTSVLNATTLGSAVVASSLTSVGTIGTGVWQGTLVAGQYGGTGVNNSGKTITIGGNFTHTGAHTLGLTTSANTSVTLPTTGTLATLAGSETLTNKTLTSPVISSITNTGTITLPTTTGTLALQADTHFIGTTSVALNRASANLALTGISSVTLPGSTSGTVQIIPTSAVGTGTVLTIPATTGTIVTTGDSATVTNTMLAGSIANAKLTNSSVTIGSTAVSLGATVTTFAGLASVTSTTFVGALTGNASTATTLATTRAIYGNNFDGSAALTGIIASTYGGTGNGFTKFTGPTTAEKTFTLPDASSTIVVQGGALGTPSSGTLTNCTFPTLNQSTTGSAATLTTPRAINGVNFDGSAAITVTAAAGTLSGTTLNATVVSSSLTSVGTIATGVWNGTAITGQYGGTGVNNSGKTITLGGNLTTSGAFTTTLTSTANTSVTLPTTGTLATDGPVFRAYVDTAQTITSSGTQQKVTFGTETFDSNSNFASSRFTPTVAGYYQINATVRISGGSSTGENMLIIWKNGSEYARGTNQSGTEQGVNFYSMQVSDIAVANGSTDYFEIYIQQTSGASKDITAGSNISYFSGCMVRGA
jgi:hypothetical protein